MKKPTLFNLCKTAAYIGAIGYGGVAILALIRKIIVKKNHWISDHEFMNAMSLAQILPGSPNVSVVSYIGFKLHKLWGGILVPLFFIMPAALLMIILSQAYLTYGSSPYVRILLAALGALVVALLANATYVLGKSVYKKMDVNNAKGLAISLIAFADFFIFKTAAIWVILLSGFLGFVFFFFTKGFKDEILNRDEAMISRPAVGHTGKLKLKDYIPVIIVVAILLFALILPLTRELVATFLKIGSFAFGSGFTAMPVIQNEVVVVHHWLSNKTFLDGIALGQITPGPVFITATFIGYQVAALTGALLATLAVFTPSVTAMIALADIHAKTKNLRAVQIITKGFLCGFIGLLAAITMQFAVSSLISWQAWLIFILGICWLILLKKNSTWAILGTIALSLLIYK